MFWERFYNLCLERGTKPNRVCSELGFSNATSTKWKNGSIPGTEKINKIAEYFNVSVPYLLGYEEQKEKSPAGAGLKEKHWRLITAYERAEEPIKYAVDRLLKIEEKPEISKIAARNGESIETVITEEQWEKIKNLPDADL